MYKAKSGADNGIRSVKKNAALDERYDRRESKKGEPYFVLLAANKQAIGQSEMYSSVGAMENGINSVKTNAPDVNVDDLTLTYQVAVACQGGGSHTAFTAGALRTILQKLKQDGFNIVALSGTSGGAICAFLAWYGLLKNDVELADGLLRKFWEKNSTNTPWDAATNSAVIISQSQMVRADLSPCWFPEYGRYTLKTLLENLVDVDSISDLIQKNSPKLYVGAVNVRSGSFRVFIDQEVSPRKT